MGCSPGDFIISQWGVPQGTLSYPNGVFPRGLYHIPMGCSPGDFIISQWGVPQGTLSYPNGVFPRGLYHIPMGCSPGDFIISQWGVPQGTLSYPNGTFPRGLYRGQNTFQSISMICKRLVLFINMLTTALYLKYATKNGICYPGFC